jgi:hypothetical protein
MKVNQDTHPLAFGEFIMAAYDALGKRRAKGLIWLAVNSGLVEFHGRHRFLFSRRGPKHVANP